MSDAGETRDRVLVEMTIAAPAEAVWDALKDPGKIYNWHGWDAPELRDEVEYIYSKYGRYDDAAMTLRFEGMGDRFEVEPRGGESVLRVVRAMPADAEWDDIYEDMTEGWISFVEQLRLGLEQHDMGPRRTIYLSGSGAVPSEALGLGGLLDTPPGERVQATLATGDAVDGVAWHRTPWQFGVTMPQWGDGLLIVTDKSRTDEAPDGRGMVILTTYDMDDAAFAALEARWKDWWGRQFAESGGAGCG